VRDIDSRGGQLSEQPVAKRVPARDAYQAHSRAANGRRIRGAGSVSAHVLLDRLDPGGGVPDDAVHRPDQDVHYQIAVAE
jgi:hypothetical protein